MSTHHITSSENYVSPHAAPSNAMIAPAPMFNPVNGAVLNQAAIDAHTASLPVVGKQVEAEEANVAPGAVQEPVADTMDIAELAVDSTPEQRQANNTNVLASAHKMFEGTESPEQTFKEIQQYSMANFNGTIRKALAAAINAGGKEAHDALLEIKQHILDNRS